MDDDMNWFDEFMKSNGAAAKNNGGASDTSTAEHMTATAAGTSAPAPMVFLHPSIGHMSAVTTAGTSDPFTVPAFVAPMDHSSGQMTGDPSARAPYALPLRVPVAPMDLSTGSAMSITPITTEQPAVGKEETCAHEQPSVVVEGQAAEVEDKESASTSQPFYISANQYCVVSDERLLWVQGSVELLRGGLLKFHQSLQQALQYLEILNKTQLRNQEVLLRNQMLFGQQMTLIGEQLLNLGQQVLLPVQEQPPEQPEGSTAA